MERKKEREGKGERGGKYLGATRKNFQSMAILIYERDARLKPRRANGRELKYS